MKIAYVFFNGDLNGSQDFFKNFIKNNNGDIYVADGGANLLNKLDLIPLELWGDLDSIDEKILRHYKNNNVIIKIFPKEKDYTDGDIILDYIDKKNYDMVIVIGALGGRKDHELTNINLLFKYKNIRFLTEKETIFNIEKECLLEDMKNKIVSFIPMTDEVKNLTLKGFKYNLQNYNLKRGDSICMSNTVEENLSYISFEKGKLLGVKLN